MNAARTRAPKAAGAEGTRLASGGSSRLRRQGRPEESPAAALRGASGWPAAGAPPRFLPVPPPPPCPHPATTPGLASGWLRRRRWAALLVLGLLVAGAADGCELVPRNLRGRRASSSAAAAASSPASAAGDSPALMTGEGRGGGEAGGAAGGLGRLLRDPIFGTGPSPCRAPASRRPRPVRDAEPGARTPVSWPLLRRGPLHAGRLPFTPDTQLSTEPLDGTRFSALQSGSPGFHAELCGGSLPCCGRASRVCRGLG